MNREAEDRLLRSAPATVHAVPDIVPALGMGAVALPAPAR